MNKWTKKLSLALCIALLATSSMTVLANEDIDSVPTEIEDQAQQVFPFYGSYSGTVKTITEREDGSFMVNVVNEEEESEANVIISENTYRVEDVELAEGMEIIGFYESNRPMILIYPPQYNLAIVADAGGDLFIEADKFDSQLVNVDNTLKLNLSEDTEIVWENNTEMDWEKDPAIEELADAISDRKLVVFYDITTRSIPAQTTPKKVIVLSKQEKAPISDVSGFEFEVNGETIEALPAYSNKAGEVMIPIRAIAEALGYEVGWDGAKQAVTIEYTQFSLNQKNVVSFDTEVTLENAPVLKDETTYVPMEFFEKAFFLRTAEVYEGRIVFEN